MPQLSISKILVPVDFSRRAEGAVRAAERLAAHFNAELVVLHVTEPFHVDYAMVEPFEVPLRALAQGKDARVRAQLDAFALRSSPRVKVTRTILEGDAAGRILEHARTAQADLIVMPTQGHGRLRSLLIGSVTAKVLDGSEIPVLTGTHLQQEDDLAEWQVRNILCAVDLGSRTDCVLRWGAAIANEFGAALMVLHAAPGGNSRDQLAGKIEAAGLKAQLLIHEGEPHKVVAAAAEELQADLVIIGRGTATHTLGRLRAQAYGIVRQSPCPVLSV
jgi:nucleotide-binding universal stress UspA family protein